MTIVIDASVFCAYANIDDIHHDKAKKILDGVISIKHDLILTTDYIFDETVTVAMRRSNKKISIWLGNFLLNSEITIADIDQKIFQKAWELFKKTEKLSFTDCSTIAFMETFGINKIATFDKEFREIKKLQVIDS